MLLYVKEYKVGKLRGIVFFQFKESVSTLHEICDSAARSFEEKLRRQITDTEATKVVFQENYQDTLVSDIRSAVIAAQKSTPLRFHNTLSVHTVCVEKNPHNKPAKIYGNVPSWIKIIVETSGGDQYGFNPPPGTALSHSDWWMSPLEGQEMFLKAAFFEVPHRWTLSELRGGKTFRLSSLIESTQKQLGSEHCSVKL